MTSRCHFRRGLSALALLLAPAIARAEFSAEKLALIDRPFVGEQLALSPDGRYLAYTQHAADRHTLLVADLERKATRAIPLTIGQRTDRGYRRLTVLRWASPDRLVLQEADGQVAAIDPDGRNAVRLWTARDDGLVEDMYMRKQGLLPIAEPPRVLPLQPEPGFIFIESSARLGGERLANLFKVHAGTGETQRMNRSLYTTNQVALYGPGDLLIHAGGQWQGRNREERSRVYLANLDMTPEYGGPVIAESSSTGVMLYDRQGRPRILYEQPPKRDRHRFSYVPPGDPPFLPNVIPIALEEFLGQRTRRQETMGAIGEFEIRPETYFGERSYPIAFDDDPEVVYLASSVGRDTWGIYSLNLRTRERVDLAPGLKGIDLVSGDPEEGSGMLVFDEARGKLVGIRYTAIRAHTYWLDPELEELQAAADRLLPRFAVEIVAWDTERRRFVLRASAEDDPGAIFVYHRVEDRLERLTGRAPWLAGIELKPSAPFDFQVPGGSRLTGYITLPTRAVVDPPPLLLYCAAGLWDRAEPGFNREAEMLADMGVVVLRLNYRGTAGFGRQHLLAIQEGMDTVPVADLLAAIDWVASRRPIDRKRVVVMGEGFGGYLALRAVQDHPARFRAAISVNAPTDLSAWARPREIPGRRPMKPFSDPLYDAMRPYYDYQSLVRTAFVRQAKRGDADLAASVDQGNFRKPVLLVSNPLSTDLTSGAALLGMLGFGHEGMSFQRMTMSGDFVGGTLENRTRVFQRIEEFLNVNLYEYDTELGALKEIQGPAPANGKRP